METTELKRLALQGLDLEIARLNTLRQELLRPGPGRKPGSTSQKPPTVKPAGKKRVLSAATRKRMSDLMKARWAAKKKAKNK